MLFFVIILLISVHYRRNPMISFVLGVDRANSFLVHFVISNDAIRISSFRKFANEIAIRNQEWLLDSNVLRSPDNRSSVGLRSRTTLVVSTISVVSQLFVEDCVYGFDAYVALKNR